MSLPIDRFKFLLYYTDIDFKFFYKSIVGIAEKGIIMETETKVIKPILAYGTFGLHILVNPTGTYGFVGTIPENLYGITGDTEIELMEDFFLWLDTCSIKDKKELIPLLRNDIFVMYLNRISHWA